MHFNRRVPFRHLIPSVLGISSLVCFMIAWSRHQPSPTDPGWDSTPYIHRPGALDAESHAQPRQAAPARINTATVSVQSVGNAPGPAAAELTPLAEMGPDF